MKIDDFFPSKYLKAADFEGDLGDQILTIVSVTREDFEGDKKPIVCFQETNKELVLNRTNFKTIAHLHGQDSDSWAGQKIQLFMAEVEFKGDHVPAVRVRMTVPGARLQGNVTDIRTISADQRRLLFDLSMTAFNQDKVKAEAGVKTLMDFLVVTSTADINRTDFDRIKELLESGRMPAEWAGKFIWSGPLDITDDDIPF